MAERRFTGMDTIAKNFGCYSTSVTRVKCRRHKQPKLSQQGKESLLFNEEVIQTLIEFDLVFLRSRKK